MTDTYQPTPTQEENDLARVGQSVVDKEPDGSPEDTNNFSPPTPPSIASLAPATAPASSAIVSVNGDNFTANSVIVFNNVDRATTYISTTVVRATFSGAAGSYPVVVRDVDGISNSVNFTFT